MRIWYPFLQLLIGISGGVLPGLIKTTKGQLFNKLKELSNTPGNIDNLKSLIKTFNHPVPKEKDLNPSDLHPKLGSIDYTYQSIERPKNLGEITKEAFPSQNKVTVPRSIDSNFAKYMQKYLEKLSFCPLGEKWIDLGDYLWPRYFKFTHCIRKKCSYPEGLVCQEKTSSNPVKIALLYWTCMPKRCGTWAKIYVSVINECQCSGCVR